MDRLESDGVEIQPAFAIDGEGAGYIAAYRTTGDLRALVSVVLPRDIVESAVLGAARITLELRLDGSLVAFCEPYFAANAGQRISN